MPALAGSLFVRWFVCYAGGVLQLLLVSFSVGCVYFVCLYRGWEGFMCCELFVCSCRLHTHDGPRIVVALTSFLLL